MSVHTTDDDKVPGAEILVVDDGLADMRLSTGILEREGFRVRPARDGELALRSARARPPALVLLDVRLPGMDGLEVCRQLKADPQTASIPVLFISALQDDRNKGAAFEAGGVDYITKPIQEEELLARVRTHLAIVMGREALARERDRAQQYLDIAGVMMIALDTAGRVTLVNRRGCEILGATQAEILGKDWVEHFVPHAERSRIRAVSARNLVGAAEFEEHVENPVLTRSGEQRIIAWRNAVIRDAHGAVTGTLSSGADVTEFRRAEAARIKSEELLAVILSSIGDGVLATDERGRVTFMNPAAEELTGWSGDEATGRPLAEVFLIRNEETNAEVESPVERVLREDKVVGLANHTKLVRRDGTEISIADSGAPIRNDVGKIIGVVLVFQDQTARRREQAREMQTDRLVSLGMLAAGVAHEINNPLAFVLYNLESLSHDLPTLTAALTRCSGAVAELCDGEERTRLKGPTPELLDPAWVQDVLPRLEDALDGTRRIKDIARGLGTFARVETTRLMPINPAQVIEPAISMVYNEIKHRARLVKEYGRTAPIMANDGRLSQVFLNLLLNAVHAIQEGDVANNEIRVRTWQEAEDVFVEVRDSGRGISEEHLPLLFEPFFTSREHAGGTGLGLSICKNIVEGYDGDIQVTSTLGEGSSFVVRLPVGRDEGPTESAPAEPLRARPDLSGRILIIDDESSIRAALARILRGHEVVQAASGEEAQKLLETDQSFDLILCDLMMPGVSGVELHQWLSTTHPDLAEQVVFVTGGAFTPRAMEYLSTVDNLQLTKPFDVPSIRKVIEERVLASRGHKS